MSALPFAEPRVVTHPSGRPWLVGCWSPDKITLVTVGDVGVAVIGRCPITATRLAGLAAEVRTLGDVDRVGLSQRVIADVLGLSHQRVHQLANAS